MPSREIALSFLGILLLDERFDSGEIKRIKDRNRWGMISKQHKSQAGLKVRIAYPFVYSCSVP